LQNSAVKDNAVKNNALKKLTDDHGFNLRIQAPSRAMPSGIRSDEIAE